ncbi:uncharacterized protein LOC141789999 [Halichoeres trimaculatus]|uniref:uncharacterized protein LOC141789999 n=1 Tax=Halichoeres trimaculatus TaxID=147232 RepID=UPI003D9F9E24
MRVREKSQGEESGQRVRKKSREEESGRRVRKKSQKEESGRRVRKKSQEEESGRRVRKKSQKEESGRRVRKKSQKEESGRRVGKKSQEEESGRRVKKKSQEEESGRRVKKKSQEEESGRRVGKKSQEEESGRRVKKKSQEEESGRRVKKKSQEEESGRRVKKKSQGKELERRVRKKSQEEESGKRVRKKKVTVKHSDLVPCDGNRHSCVTDPKDCSPRPATSTQKTLNMSCFYDALDYRTLMCEWEESESHAESRVSLIFSSQRIIFCQGLLNSVAEFNVTVRRKNYLTGREEWSRPHFVNLKKAARPPPPDLTLLSSSQDSLLLSWRCSFGCSCRIQFRENRTQTWTQAPGLVSTRRRQTLNFTIKDLLPFTAYRAAVSCREDSDFWSHWSNEVTAQTLETAPSSAPEVCYRVEDTDSADSSRLHLMWKDLDLLEAGGRVLGYQVVYEPERTQSLQDGLTQTVSEGRALLVVEAGNCSVSVRAFNGAGFGPAARLSIDTRRRDAPPAVRNLWASTSDGALLVQWETSSEAPPSPQPVSHFAVQWRSETGTSTTRWTTVDGSSSSAVIRDLDPELPYLISVFPVYDQQCGPPRSLPASLQQGALMEVVRLKAAGVTKTTLTVSWVWRRRSPDVGQASERVGGYSLMLRGDSGRQTLALWPDQSQHTFHSLEPSSEYSLLLLADNSSRSILTVTTDSDEVLVVASVVPVLLLVLLLLIMSVLSRTVYKSYFFPPVSSPRGSTTGQWLMDPKHLKPAEGNILDIHDFLVTDVLGEKSLIVVTPTSDPSLREDAALLSIRHLVPTLDPDYVSDAPVFPDPVLESPRPPYHPVYSVNYPPADQDQGAHEADPAPGLLQREEESRGVSETPRQRETVFRSLLEELMWTRCEPGCVGNSSSFRGRSDAETNRSLTCDSGYIANSCFSAQTAGGDGTRPETEAGVQILSV